MAERVVVITGATGKLGPAVAERFAADGARLALLARDEESCIGVAMSLPGGIRRHRGIPVDLSDLVSATAAADTVREKLGHPQVLLHLVGTYLGGTPFEDGPLEDWHALLDVNLWSTVNAIRAFLPDIKAAEHGRIITMSTPLLNFVKLTHASPWLHHSGGTICEPVDVPVNKRHLDMVYAHISLNDQAFMGSVTQPQRARDSVDMARILFGADFVEQHCVILGNVNVNSPLVWDNAMTGSIRAYAEANQAPVIVPFILGGAMGPVTLAGDIAQAHAETLVGVALGQLVRPGSPVIYGNFLSSMALRSGSPTFGTPEPAIGSLVVGQLARRVGLPLRCAGAFTASKIADGQAMAESTMSMMSAILCGTNFVLHSAGWLEGGLSMGYEKFVMDADFCGALHRWLEGVSLDADEFALDGFPELGPGKHFFSAQHTLRHYETAFYDSPTADNNSFEQWRDAGESRTEQRAAEIVATTLAEYEPPALDESIDEALREFIDRTKASMDDMWY